MHPVETKPGFEPARTEVSGGFIVTEGSQPLGTSDCPPFAQLIGLSPGRSDFGDSVYYRESAPPLE